MKTVIDLSKTATNPLNAISRHNRPSIDAKNRTRVQKKRFVDELNENSSERTNNENLDNNVIVTTPVVRPSIGKWMYESDEHLTDSVIDLSQSSKEEDVTNSSNDDIEVIGAYSAGPSFQRPETLEEVTKNVNENELTIILDCDLNPNLLSNGLDISLLDMSCEDIDDLDVQPIEDDVITIDDTDDSVTASSAITNANQSKDDSDIIEIGRKILNPTEVDSDIEMLSEILSPSEVIDLMRKWLKDLQAATRLSFTTLRLLMSKFNWSLNTFTLNYYEHFNADKNAILKNFNIVISYELKSNSKRRKLRRKTSSESDNANTQLKTCMVCFDELNVSQMFGSECGHFLCIDCWNQYISTHVNDRSNDERICCPGDNCHNTIEDEDLLSIINDKKIADKYRRLISNSFVKNCQRLRWCPNGDCLHAIRVKNADSQDIECVCRSVFCFLCGDQWHEPLTCAQHQNWVQKYTQETIDKKSVTWLTKHTKCCPKCQFPIEKNGGCNYVSCTKCHHQFCYNCLGKCSHGRCLGRNADDALQAQAMDQWVKNDLQRYPEIKNQYQKQLKQYSIENNLQKSVIKKLENVVKCPEFRSALKFLKSAFTVLCHCRQTLVYSYVFGYYLFGPSEPKQVYEINRDRLEAETESLSRVLTSETTIIEKDHVSQIRSQVQPIYRECERIRALLVAHIKQGINDNVWQFVNTGNPVSAGHTVNPIYQIQAMNAMFR